MSGETFRSNCVLCRLPKLTSGPCAAIDCPQGKTPLTTPAQKASKP